MDLDCIIKTRDDSNGATNKQHQLVFTFQVWRCVLWVLGHTISYGSKSYYGQLLNLWQSKWLLDHLQDKDFHLIPDQKDPWILFGLNCGKFKLERVTVVLLWQHVSGASFNYASLLQFRVCWHTPQLCRSRGMLKKKKKKLWRDMSVCCHIRLPAELGFLVESTQVKMLAPYIFYMHTLICSAWPAEWLVTSTLRDPGSKEVSTHRCEILSW